jgi:hypothetical protein
MKPHREGLRPLLPQHARHCLVLEAGSALGFMVYPPLTEKESFHIEFQGEGRYQFIYSLKTPTGDFEPMFSVGIVPPVGGIGMMKEDVSILSRKTAMNRRPVAPMLVVRVETDWYAHETEFRYVPQPGEVISAAHICRSAKFSSCYVKRSRCAIALTRS